MRWAALQLRCCPSKQGELSENILQNLVHNLLPHLADKVYLHSSQTTKQWKGDALDNKAIGRTEQLFHYVERRFNFTAEWQKWVKINYKYFKRANLSLSLWGAKNYQSTSQWPRCELSSLSNRAHTQFPKPDPLETQSLSLPSFLPATPIFDFCDLSWREIKGDNEQKMQLRKTRINE